MRRKKIVSMLLVATMAATMFAGCGNDSGKKGSSGGVKEFDAFFAVPGSESMMIMKSRRSSRKRQV